VIPAFPAPVRALGIPTFPMPPVVPQAAVLTGATTGIVGTDDLGPTVPTTGNTPVSGTAGAEPTPRLLISMEPSGIPVRAAPPGAMGNVEVGVDDDAMLLEPEPHMPDVPDVSSIPEDVDVPSGIVICDDVDVPGVVAGSVVAAVGIAVLPVVAAVAGAAVPAGVPPPSKLAVDPNIPEDEVPTVEHVVPPLVIVPVVGIEIVPVTLPVGAGLTPSDVISVESSGIPVPPTDPPPIPSGEVAASEGIAASGSST
jgi:hypothetical protein